MVEEKPSKPAVSDRYLLVDVPMASIAPSRFAPDDPSPFQRLLWWAEGVVGRELGFTDISVSLVTHMALSASAFRWLQARVDAGFLSAEDVGRVTPGINGVSAPLQGSDIPAGKALLVREGRP
jgi:hypothetical protein